MARAVLASKIAVLEQEMLAINRRFDVLGGQISQLHEEMHAAIRATNDRVDGARDELHAFREEAQVALAATRAELKRDIQDTRQEMHALHEEALTALAATTGELKQDIKDARRYMLVLHEQVIERIKTIGQG